MTKDLVLLQKGNIRILAYATDLRDPSDVYRSTKINIVVGADDITLDLGSFKELMAMLESIKGHIK